MADVSHLSEAERELFELARALADEVFAPLASRGEPGRVNRPLLRALGDERLLARVLPSEGEGSAIELTVQLRGRAS